MTDLDNWLGKPGVRLGFWASIADPIVIELANLCGFDYVRIDDEYLPLDYSMIAQMIRTANLLGMPVFVRVSRMEDITSFIDYGADGIILPDADLDRAQRAAEMIKYYPVGSRGMNGGSRASRTSGLSFGDYINTANKNVTLTVQIEDGRLSADEVDEILSVEGIDFVSSGKGDISESLGVPGQTRHPDVLAFEDMVIDRCLAHNKIPCILVGNREDMQKMIAKGVKMFTVTSDQDMLVSAMTECVKGYRD